MKWWRRATVAAFALDLFTTGFAFHLGAVEANPFMVGWPFWQIVAAKGVVLGVVLAVATDGIMAKVVHGYGAGATAIVAGWNVYAVAAFVLA